MKKSKKNLNKKINQTKSFLKKNPHLKILKPDKSNKTVVMDTNIYESKMNDLLSDTDTYKEIKNDPTKTYQKLNNDLIKRWQEKNYISPKTAKTLLIHNALPPKIYGLPKLHKQGIPLRPIVSCVQSPFTYLSKFLKNILNKINNKTDSYIKDSWYFKHKISSITIPEDYSIISLDIVSLYTNIPVDLALKIIEKRWDEIKNFTDIPLQEFQTAVELTLNSTFFNYNDKYFKQIYGCAMGSAISSCIAQLVLEDMENQIIPTLKFPIPFFYRYVDDCLTAIPKGQENYILDQFHKYHNKIKFTIEIEKDNQINFLDMTLHHIDSKIETEWYTKATWSGRYLNFFSNHAMSQKKSVIIGIADRAIKLSDPHFRTKTIKKAKDILLKNSYPIRLINSIFTARLQKNNILSQNNAQTVNPQNKINNYLTLPYINRLSENIQKTFRKHNITVSHKANN